MVILSMEQRETWLRYLIINRLLSARKYGKESVEQFIKKDCFREVSFYNPIQRSTIATSLNKDKQRKVMSVPKEDLQVLELFVEKYPEKHETFKYPLIIFSFASSTPEGKLYQLIIKYLFRSYLIELSNARVTEINLTHLVIYDVIAIVLSNPSEKAREF